MKWSKKMLSGVAIGGTCLMLVGCGANDKKDETTKSSSSVPKTEQIADYDRQEQWQFVAGKMQSPINLDTKHVVDADAKNNNQIKIDLSGKVDSINHKKDHFVVKTSGDAMIAGRHFTIKSIEFHTPSEHTINKKHHPVEMEIKGVAKDGRIAMVSIFMDKGKENPAMATLLNDAKDNKTDPITDIAALFPNLNNYYHYIGSLTTVPLTENVEWYVVKDPVQLSDKQYDELHHYCQNNNRKTQPLNDRDIEYTDGNA